MIGELENKTNILNDYGNSIKIRAHTQMRAHTITHTNRFGVRWTIKIQLDHPINKLLTL